MLRTLREHFTSPIFRQPQERPKLDFSIIICTYNPQPELLLRVLDSCMAQNTSTEFEVLVVDNNSSTEFPPIGPGISMVAEKKQGLAYARITGFRASKGKTLVFVDDDNIIAPDYLANLEQVLINHPQVGVWGPGRIMAEFAEGGPSWLKKNFAGYFQAKDMRMVQYGREKSWPPFYPAGSGISVSREIFRIYAEAFEGGSVSLTGRKGTLLSSGEDAQMVWLAVKNGYAAGSAPGMRLTHVISREKQSLDYLRRLQYNIARSYYSALTEIFPDQRKQIRPLSFPGYARLACKVLLRARFRPALFIRMYILEFAWFKGLNYFLRRS